MNIFKMPVHPAAAVFPMLADDELDELAADIKAHGLQQPIVVKDDQLIDGRNRREACRRIGFEPVPVELNGADPVAYIISANISRRHLTKGQRAMAIATLYPEPEKGGRGKKAVANTEFSVSSGNVSHARTVLATLPEVAAAVLAGTKPLSEAYADALKARANQESDVRRLARLRERAPDLADRVDDGMALIEAESAYETRQEEQRRERLAITENFNQLDRLVDFFGQGKRRDHLIEHLQQPDDRKRAQGLLKQWIKNLTATLEALS